MEVLETVDREPPRRAARARRVLLARPHRPGPGRDQGDRRGRSACTRSRSRTRSSSTSGRSSTTTATTCCSSIYTVRQGRNAGERLFEPVEVHIYISGAFVVTVRRADVHRARRAARGARRPPTRRPRTTSSTRSSTSSPTPSTRSSSCSRSASTRSRAGSCSAGPAASSSPRSTASSRASTSSRGASSPSATASSAGSDTILDLPGLARGTREYLRDVGDHLAQIAGELHRQQEDLTALTATYFNANANRLNASRRG